MNPLESKDYLSLLALHIDDGFDYYTLMRVNRLCYKVFKEMLVHEKDKKRTWIELPGVPGVYNGALIRKRPNGELLYKHHYINGLKHGPAFNMNSTIQFTYKQGKLKAEMSRFAQSIYYAPPAQRPYLVAVFLFYFLFIFEGCCKRKTSKL